MPNKAENRQWRSGLKIDSGTYVGVVMDNVDELYNNRLAVWISSFGGDPKEKVSWKIVSYANPFYGITPYSTTKKLINSTSSSNSQNPSTVGFGENTNDEIQTFGMWTQPPAIGTKVLVVFTDNDDSRGYWIAAIPEQSHAMVPARGAGKSGKPESEFDPASSDVLTATDVQQVERPELKDEAAKYETQGIDKDQFRGFISTSSFRESPSKVMGFSTPSGHSIAMDDGDEDNKSKLIRIRTAAGNQITLNDDNGMIYLINAQGTGWLELSPTGHLDVYAEAGINLATKKDINLHADNDINIHAGNNLKMVALNGAKLQGTSELQLHGKKTLIEGVDALHMHSCNEVVITSFKDIYMKAFENFVLQGKCWRWNSGAAKEAEQVPPEQPKTVSDYNSTVARAPAHEPYKEHDNGESQQSGQQIVPATGLTPEQIGQQADNARLSGYRAIQEMGPSSGPSTTPQRNSNYSPYSSTGETTGLQNAAKVSSTGNNPTGSFASPNLPSFDPQQLASQAINSIGGNTPASNIPAGIGGGQSGFAKGENCARPGGNAGTSTANPDNLDTTLGQSPEDRQKIYDDLRNNGLSHEQAIGAMANINRESGFRPGAIGDNGNSYGLFQFNRGAGRLDPFVSAVPDWQTNSTGQINYMFNQEQGAGYKQIKFGSSLEAANYFTNKIEIPAARASYTASGGYNSRIVSELESTIVRRP